MIRKTKNFRKKYSKKNSKRKMKGGSGKSLKNLAKNAEVLGRFRNMRQPNITTSSEEMSSDEKKCHDLLKDHPKVNEICGIIKRQHDEINVKQKLYEATNRVRIQIIDQRDKAIQHIDKIIKEFQEEKEQLEKQIDDAYDTINRNGLKFFELSKKFNICQKDLKFCTEKLENFKLGVINLRSNNDTGSEWPCNQAEEVVAVERNAEEAVESARSAEARAEIQIG